MKRSLAGLLLLLSLAGSAVGQPGGAPRVSPRGGGGGLAQNNTQGTQESAGSVVEICRQALEVARASNWSGPAAVRLELLHRQAGLIQSGQGDLDRYLRFFSVSRQVFHYNHPPPAVAAKLRELEVASQRMAGTAGNNLDLPPLGGAPAFTDSTEVAPVAPPPSLTEFKTSVQKADDLAQSLWSDVRNVGLPPGGDTLGLRARQDLVGIAESLRNLKIALEEGSDARSRWESLNTNRIRFLSSYARLPELDQRLPKLIQALEELAETGRRSFGP